MLKKLNVNMDIEGLEDSGYMKGPEDKDLLFGFIENLTIVALDKN